MSLQGSRSEGPKATIFRGEVLRGDALLRALTYQLNTLMGTGYDEVLSDVGNLE